MTSCKTEDISKRMDNEQKVLKAMTEYPGNGLYDPTETVIGLGAPDQTEEELAESEQKAADEKEAWQKAVGDCFADGMFDTFYSEWYRTHVVGTAWAFGLTTTMSDFSIEDELPQDSDNIEHALTKVIATDKEGKTQSFDMDWQVIYDKDDHNLLQKIELIDDGGFYETYTDSFEIGSGLNVEPYDGAIPYKAIGTIDGQMIIVTYASDVQYDFNDEAAAEEYMAIRNEAETIQEGGKSGPLILK